MYDGGRVVEVVANTQLQKLVAEWILGSFNAISEKTVQNARRKKCYEWFIDCNSLY